MKYLDEYRDARLARALIDRIAGEVRGKWVLMEICGGQTHTIMRYGLDQLLPRNIELVHGPGCPVCVTPLESIEKALQLASCPDVILASYGDMLRVPGSQTDLMHVKARGGDVRVIYSPDDALKIARQNPDRNVVFLAIGFETTAPAHAAAIAQAHREGMKNFSVLASHVLVPPAIRALMTSPGCRVNGLIAPGHVCTVTGFKQYETIVSDFHIPIVVGGFEPVDLLEAVFMLVRQLERGEAKVENQYSRYVSRTGNRAAQSVVEDVFEVADQKWRGIGTIPASGLRIRDKYQDYDADRIFGLPSVSAEEPVECISAKVLQGLKRPTDCTAFAIRCSPQNPMGALMVSPEGACAAYYNYRGSVNSRGDAVAETT
jgi:hydrogenase expression/formation protein HypD